MQTGTLFQTITTCKTQFNGHFTMDRRLFCFASCIMHDTACYSDRVNRKHVYTYGKCYNHDFASISLEGFMYSGKSKMNC